MSVAANQQRTFLRLLATLRPHWHRDAALPARIQSQLSSHREFGSRDRRLYRELIYTTLRHRPWIEPLLDGNADEATRRVAWLAAEMPATAPFRAAFAVGEPPNGDKADLLPAWFRSHCPEIFSGQELETQLRRAPLWLRLQTDESREREVLEEFRSRGWPWRRSPVLASAIELLSEADVTSSTAWREGNIEVQDLGSQLLLPAVGIEPGETWLDACAGAGGKSLQLAPLLGPAGRIDAHDVRTAALAELQARADRAGITTYREEIRDTPASSESKPRHPQPAKKSDAHNAPLDAERSVRNAAAAPISITPRVSDRLYDGVLVDAPCSGSGTWRRAPHLKWILTASQIEAAAGRQRALLHEFSRNVTPGGRLVYATCSLSRHENEEVVAGFLAEHPEFQPEPFAETFGATMRGHGLTILPSLHNTDGFFVATLRRR
jgi:16S rRNA (cytosine967-C5)-methyltransferase